MKLLNYVANKTSGFIKIEQRKSFEEVVRFLGFCAKLVDVDYAVYDG